VPLKQERKQYITPTKSNKMIILRCNTLLDRIRHENIRGICEIQDGPETGNEHGETV